MSWTSFSSCSLLVAGMVLLLCPVGTRRHPRVGGGLRMGCCWLGGQQCGLRSRDGGVDLAHGHPYRRIGGRGGGVLGTGVGGDLGGGAVLNGRSLLDSEDGGFPVRRYRNERRFEQLA